MKILTINLRATADRWHERFPMLVGQLCRHNPDVIALQEARLHAGQAHHIAEALNRQVSGRPYDLYVCEDWYEPHILANAMLSRLPVYGHGRIELSHGYRSAHRIRVRFGHQWVTIANTHLHHKPHDDEIIRLEQMTHILAWLRAQNTPCIIVGDLNARPESTTLMLAKQTLASAYEVVHGAEPAFTFPTPLRTESLAPRTIDYILFTPSAIQVESAALFGETAHPDDATLYLSDHLGLVAQLRPL